MKKLTKKRIHRLLDWMDDATQEAQMAVEDGDKLDKAQRGDTEALRTVDDLISFYENNK